MVSMETDLFTDYFSLFISGNILTYKSVRLVAHVWIVPNSGAACQWKIEVATDLDKNVNLIVVQVSVVVLLNLSTCRACANVNIYT